MFYTSMSVVPKLVMQHWARSREVAGHGQLPVLGHGGVSDGKRGGDAVVLSAREIPSGHVQGSLGSVLFVIAAAWEAQCC